MGWWTSLRDSVEAAAVPIGNYFLPGSSLVTSQLVSEGAKQKLNSDFGNLAMLGSGIAGGANGNMSNYGSLGEMFNSAPSTMTAPDVTPTATTTGTVPTTLGDVTAPTTPAFSPTTVSQGSNLPVDTTTGPINPGPNMIGSDFEQMPQNMPAYSAVNAPLATSSPGFLASMGAGNFGDAASAAGTWAANNPIPAIYGAGSLYDMYAKKQMANKQQAMYDQNRADILNTYQPGSPEYNLLKQEMDRKDAAAGRNSQYGVRANEFAGKIAGLRLNALGQMQTGQNALANTAMGNQYGMFNTPLTLAALTATSKGK
ncbi:hypothetical protein UFOVP128_30 [uncultured Caudovirales phage]|uniref:Uncharacterized protein n=1 Tax=uncultured Caudovirales phage TaxID=2100421 RepID=A0A6J5LBR3_9CAUD|nr:hypothetical protein UFOVP128_30 [uncultured Caudovirales phage]CAB5222045.1 hypothetical protein UFOVP243_14 [uncultured Caudovirales phage]